MVFVGIDVGSVATKAVVLQERRILSQAIVPTGWSPKNAGSSVFGKAIRKAGLRHTDVKRIVGTGYGRISLDFIDHAVTEITCHALGVNYWFPQDALIIDIGGQDSKAITIDSKGKILKFVMNDKCAAGTGRFLQVIVYSLGLELDQLEELDLAEPASINSMCTVFAESEIIGLLAAGVAKERIVSGVYHSIAKRVSTMIGASFPISKVVFTGGVANNKGMEKIMAKVLGLPVVVPNEPQMIGALGAALVAESLK